MAYSLNMFLDSVLEKCELKRINRKIKQDSEKKTRKLITDLMSTLRDFQIEVVKTVMYIETVKQNGFSNFDNDTELALKKSIFELTNTWTSIKARYAECPANRVHSVYGACNEESLFTRYTYVTENYLKLLSETLSIMFKRSINIKSGSVTTNDNKVKSDSMLPTMAMYAEVDIFVNQLGCFKTDLEILTKTIFASQYLNTPLDPTSTANEDLIKKLADAWELIDVQKDRCGFGPLNLTRQNDNPPSPIVDYNYTLGRYQSILTNYRSEVSRLTPKK